MRPLIVLLALVTVGGCEVGVTADEQREVSAEFSPDRYTEAMLSADKGRELIDEKRRERDHLKGTERAPE